MGYQSPLPPHPGPTECLQEGLYANCSTVVLFQIWHAHKTVICIFRVCMNSTLQCKVHEHFQTYQENTNVVLREMMEGSLHAIGCNPN